MSIVLWLLLWNLPFFRFNPNASCLSGWLVYLNVTSRLFCNLWWDSGGVSFVFVCFFFASSQSAFLDDAFRCLTCCNISVVIKEILQNHVGTLRKNVRIDFGPNVRVLKSSLLFNRSWERTDSTSVDHLCFILFNIHIMCFILSLFTLVWFSENIKTITCF